jgi:hypothetical protein
LQHQNFHLHIEQFLLNLLWQPELKELTQLVHTISLRVARFLERRGLLERDDEDSYLTLDFLDDEPMYELHGHAITYRIVLGPQQGRKVFTLQTIPPSKTESSVSTLVANIAGFSLYADILPYMNVGYLDA